MIRLKLVILFTAFFELQSPVTVIFLASTTVTLCTQTASQNMYNCIWAMCIVIASSTIRKCPAHAFKTKLLALILYATISACKKPAEYFVLPALLHRAAKEICSWTWINFFCRHFSSKKHQDRTWLKKIFAETIYFKNRTQDRKIRFKKNMSVSDVK